MDSIATVRDLFAYDLWANRRVDAALDADTPARARELMGHVLAAQAIWLDRIDGVAPPTSAAGDASVVDFSEAIDRLHTRLARLLDDADEADLDRVVDYADLRGNPYHTPLRDILVHLAHHGTYHRAQIAATLKEAGRTPPRTDFIIYWRDTKDRS